MNGDLISAILSVMVLVAVISFLLFSLIFTLRNKINIKAQSDPKINVHYGVLFEEISLKSNFSLLFSTFFTLRRLILVGSIILL